MKQKILLFLILCVELFALFQWIPCRDFAGHFHFSAYDLELRLIDGIHSDHNVPIWMVRMFHNKIAGTGLDLVGEYIQFWNVAFLASFVSLAGVVGLAAQFYYFFLKKKKPLFVWFVFLFLLLIPFVEMLHPDTLAFLPRLFLVALAFLLWSMLGYWNLLKEKNLNTKFIDAILLISLWYQVVIPTFTAFCVLK